MSDLTHLTLAEARDALKSKKISAVELTKAHLSAVEDAQAHPSIYKETRCPISRISPLPTRATR